MNWKIGDKVRLTGEKWGDYDGDETYRGAVLEVTGIHKGGYVQLTNKPRGYYWKINPGWEIELVERKEEEMSVDFTDVNVGDKVRLTRENGDETTFTVKIKSKQFISSESQNFSTKLWNTLEIVERAFKPVPGLYTNNKTDARLVLLESGEAYYTSNKGAWITTDHENENWEAYQVVREQDGWRREITF